MVGVPIHLTGAQWRRLRDAARCAGVSPAALARRSLDVYLGQLGADRRARYAQAAGLVGRFADRAGAADLSRRHDAYLDERRE